jgi:hypothetical protein
MIDPSVVSTATKKVIAADQHTDGTEKLLASKAGYTDQVHSQMAAKIVEVKGVDQAVAQKVAAKIQSQQK